MEFEEEPADGGEFVYTDDEEPAERTPPPQLPEQEGSQAEAATPRALPKRAAPSGAVITGSRPVHSVATPVRWSDPSKALMAMIKKVHVELEKTNGRLDSLEKNAAVDPPSERLTGWSSAVVAM